MMNVRSLPIRLSLLKLIVLATILFTGTYCKLFGQVFPVTGSLTWTPPYTPVLSEIGLPSTSDNFRLMLLLNDQQNLSATIKLKFKIEGSVRIQTDPSYQGLPITLNHGSPENFYGVDLSEYLRATSLQFSGITRDQYIRNASIPDGFYKVSFQAFDFQTNEQLSDEIFINVFIATNEPPLLVAPTCGEKLRLSVPQYIMFSWIPRQINSGITDYEFSLYWIQPKGRPPGDVVLTSVPIYQETTQATSLIYSSSEPALIPGEEYVWRVQAKDRSEISNYHQQGFSQSCKFQFSDACFPPENVTATVEGAQRVKISWDESPAVVRYSVEYRLKNSDAGQWYPLQTTNTNYTLSSQLRASTSYEYRVQSVCGLISSDYSEVDTFRTADLFQNRTLQCGTRSSIPLPDSTLKLATIKAGDKIQMGGFTMTILEASGSNGRFSGKVEIPVNLLNTSLQGDFTDLRINSSYQVFGGVINIRSGSIALLPPDVQQKVNTYLNNINTVINTVDGGLNTATGILNNGNTVLNEIEKIATTVSNVDSTLSKQIEEIKNKIQEGMNMITNGDSTEGKNIFLNALNQLNEILGNGVENITDKLKALVQRLTLERKTKDSTERVSILRELMDNEQSVNDAQQSIAKDIDDIDLGGEKQNELAEPAYAMFDDGDIPQDVVGEEQLGKIKAQQPKYGIYNDGIEALVVKTNRLKYLEKGVEIAVILLTTDNLKIMVDNIKEDSKNMGAVLMKDVMDGTISKSVEDYVKDYLTGVIEYRINEAISQQ